MLGCILKRYKKRGEPMNTNKLRSVMVLHGDNGVKLARALGISQNSLSKKMTGKSQFTQDEIWQIKERYGLTPVEVDEIFFAQSVS